MSELSRREFAKLIGAVSIASSFPLQSQATSRTIGIQVGAVSFVDEEVESVLDRFQRDANINALFIASFSYGRGIAGRQVPGQPLPDYGKQEYDAEFHGGNFARTHEKYYAHTTLKKIEAPDHPGFDVLASVLPQAQSRRMKVFCWFEDVFRCDLEGIDRLQEVTLSGKKASTLCFHNPEVQAFWQALTEDYVRSYPIDGLVGKRASGPFRQRDRRYARRRSNESLSPKQDHKTHQSPVPILSVRPLISALFWIISLAYSAVPESLVSAELSSALRQQSSVMRTWALASRRTAR